MCQIEWHKTEGDKDVCVTFEHQGYMEHDPRHVLNRVVVELRAIEVKSDVAEIPFAKGSYAVSKRTVGFGRESSRLKRAEFSWPIVLRNIECKRCYFIPSPSFQGIRDLATNWHSHYKSKVDTGFHNLSLPLFNVSLSRDR